MSDIEPEIEYLPDHSIADLIQLALEQMDFDGEISFRSSALAALHLRRESADVFEAIQRLRTSEIPKERALFADVLGQLGTPERPYRDETVTMLLDMLQHETDPWVLESIGVAFGHLDDPRAIEPVARLKNHPDKDVRFGVVLAMSGYEIDLAINTLIELSRDTDTDVRDWATFGLGSQIELDTPAIHEALYARVTDDDPETRGEALIGLAQRQDQRVLEHVRRELQGEFHGIWAVEAAEYLADPSLYPLIQALWDRLHPEERQKSWFESQFQDSLAACKPAD